jgi:hypothetical protein
VNRVRSRSDLGQFVGWTVVTVSGDLVDEDAGDRPSRLRLRLRPPGAAGQRSDVDVYVHAEEDDDGSPCLAFEALVPFTAKVQ